MSSHFAHIAVYYCLLYNDYGEMIDYWTWNDYRQTCYDIRLRACPNAPAPQ